MDGRVERRGALLVFASAAVWSFGGAIARYLSVGDSWAVICWRSLCAALFLLGFMVWNDGWAGTRRMVAAMGWAGVGVGLFAAEGFFPDFLLWLKRGKHQALAFVEPKGLRHQWPQDKFDLLEHVVPAWKFSVPMCGYILSANTEAELDRIQPGFSWSSAPSVLLHQDAQGEYVEGMLRKILALLPQNGRAR